MEKNKHIGSSIDDLLKEEGIYEKVEAQAIKEGGEGQVMDEIEIGNLLMRPPVKPSLSWKQEKAKALPM